MICISFLLLFVFVIVVAVLHMLMFYRGLCEFSAVSLKPPKI